MVALVQRVRKLEKKVADRSQPGRLDDRVVYQPSADELAEAVVILVGGGEGVWQYLLSRSSLLQHQRLGNHTGLFMRSIVII